MPEAKSADALRLLIVDDEESVLAAMVDFFEDFGWHVDSAAEFEEAEALIANRQYDAFICDLRLKGPLGTEGLELIRDIRQCAPAAAVLLFSGVFSDEVERTAIEYGADAVMWKPVPLGLVAEKLAAASSARRDRASN